MSNSDLRPVGKGGRDDSRGVGAPGALHMGKSTFFGKVEINTRVGRKRHLEMLGIQVKED